MKTPIQTQPGPGLALVSHPLCPFNQRCVLTLLVSGRQRDKDFAVHYVDLAQPPPWFEVLSPQREFPLLCIDGQLASHSAGDIVAYFEEQFCSDTLAFRARSRLRERALVTLAAQQLGQLRSIFVAQDSAQFAAALQLLFDGLPALEDQLTLAGVAQAPDPLSPDPLSLSHIALAPFFCLAMYFPLLANHPRWAATPQLYALGLRLLAHADVQASCCPDYAQAFARFFEIVGGFAGSALQAG